MFFFCRCLLPNRCNTFFSCCCFSGGALVCCCIIVSRTSFNFRKSWRRSEAQSSDSNNQRWCDQSDSLSFEAAHVFFQFFGYVVRDFSVCRWHCLASIHYQLFCFEEGLSVRFVVAFCWLRSTFRSQSWTAIHWSADELAVQHILNRIFPISRRKWLLNTALFSTYGNVCSYEQKKNAYFSSQRKHAGCWNVLTVAACLSLFTISR